MEPCNINTLGLSALLVFCVRFKVTQTGPSRGLPSKAETLFDTKTQRLRSSKFELGTKGSLLPSEDGLTFTIWGLKIPWNSTPKLKKCHVAVLYWLCQPDSCQGVGLLAGIHPFSCLPIRPVDLWYKPATCGTRAYYHHGISKPSYRIDLTGAYFARFC